VSDVYRTVCIRQGRCYKSSFEILFHCLYVFLISVSANGSIAATNRKSSYFILNNMHAQGKSDNQ
jgi:hypothetical protein